MPEPNTNVTNGMQPNADCRTILEPRIVPASRGFLAVTDDSESPRIGVFARSEGEARSRFKVAMEESLAILDRSR